MGFQAVFISMYLSLKLVIILLVFQTVILFSVVLCSYLNACLVLKVISACLSNCRRFLSKGGNSGHWSPARPAFPYKMKGTKGQWDILPQSCTSNSELGMQAVTCVKEMSASGKHYPQCPQGDCLSFMFCKFVAGGK